MQNELLQMISEDLLRIIFHGCVKLLEDICHAYVMRPFATARHLLNSHPSLSAIKLGRVLIQSANWVCLNISGTPKCDAESVYQRNGKLEDMPHSSHAQ